MSEAMTEPSPKDVDYVIQKREVPYEYAKREYGIQEPVCEMVTIEEKWVEAKEGEKHQVLFGNWEKGFVSMRLESRSIKNAG